MWVRVLDCLSRFRLIVACYKILSRNWIWKYFSTLHSPAMKWFLNISIFLSAFIFLWLIGGTNWYLIFIVDIVRFKALYASFFIKCKPGCIYWLFKYSVKDVKALNISFSLLLFIAVVRMSLQSYTYITLMYLFPLLKVLVKRPHWYD